VEIRVRAEALSIDGRVMNVNEFFFRNSVDKLAADSYLPILLTDARTRRSTT
jgi:hypothetical protein